MNRLMAGMRRQRMTEQSGDRQRQSRSEPERTSFRQEDNLEKND